MKLFEKISLFLLVSLSLFAFDFEDCKSKKCEIKEYKVVKKCVNIEGKKALEIRSFFIEEKRYGLLINLDTLKTSVASDFGYENCEIIHTNYYNLKQQSKKNMQNLQNAGITKLNSHVALSVDMCPSSKVGYEDRLFKRLSDLGKLYESKKFPIAIAITKKWISNHQKEFHEILTLNLDITWINHSSNHFYDPKLPLSQNFMIANKEVDIESEITDVEKYLLNIGEIPSVFFRFPGLVSNAFLIDSITEKFSLIPLGSNTWLAKGDKIKDGSIILIHGNKNEPKGVELFMDFLDKNEATLMRVKDLSIQVETKL